MSRFVKSETVALLLSALLLIPSAQALVIPNGLIGYWTGNGTTADSTPNGNDGTLVGNTTYAQGIFGQAFSLDGSGDFVSIPDDDLWSFSGDFTVAVWATFATLPGGSIGNPGSTFIAHDEGGGNQDKWWLAMGSDQVNFHINGPGLVFLAETTLSPILLDTWYHFAAKREGNLFTIFIDGVAGNSESSSLPITNASTPLTIGWSEISFYHHGLIDDVTLYDRALSNSEIAILASVPEPSAFVVVLGLFASAIVLVRKRRRSNFNRNVPQN